MSRWHAAALAALVGCANLDGFFFNPQPTDAYTLAYEASVPAAWRVPEALRRPLELRAEDGTIVHAVFARRPGVEATTAPTVLYHHGNARNIDYYWARAGRLWSLGANVLIYDYRGYGRTRGTPSEDGLYQDARAALAWLRSTEANVDPSGIVHYGYSLGGAIATRTAATQGSCAGLVLESTFASAAALVEDSSVLVPRELVTGNQFDTNGLIVRAARNAGRVLLFHGEGDDFVRPENSQRLAATLRAAGLPHALVIVPNADHGTVPNGPSYDANLAPFLARR